MPLLTDKEKLKEKYNYYYDRHNRVEESFNKTSSNLDKLIFAISSGTIVLSITFLSLEKIDKNTSNMYLIYSAWGFLIFTLILNLLTHIFLMESFKKSLIILKDWLLETPLVFASPDYAKTWQAKCANILNIVSVVTLIIGIIFLAIFAGLNIS